MALKVLVFVIICPQPVSRDGGASTKVESLSMVEEAIAATGALCYVCDLLQVFILFDNIIMPQKLH